LDRYKNPTDLSNISKLDTFHLSVNNVEYDYRIDLSNIEELTNLDSSFYEYNYPIDWSNSTKLN